MRDEIVRPIVWETIVAAFMGGALHHFAPARDRSDWRLARAIVYGFIVGLTFAFAGTWLDGTSTPADPFRAVARGALAFALFLVGWLFDAWLNRDRAPTN